MKRAGIVLFFILVFISPSHAGFDAGGGGGVDEAAVAGAEQKAYEDWMKSHPYWQAADEIAQTVKFSGSFSKDKVQEQQIENMINGLQCYFATDEHGCDALRDQLEEARYVPPPLKDAVNKTVNGMTGYLENRKSAERLREWETYCEGDDNDPECKKFHDAEVSGPTLSAHDANQETLGPSNLGEHSDAAKGQSDAPSSTSSPYDCAVLDDETQSRQLMTEDQQKWLDLTQNPQIDKAQM